MGPEISPLHSTPLCSVPVEMTVGGGGTGAIGTGDFSVPLSTVEMTVGRAAYRKKDCEEMILIFSQSLLF